jgi:hypothetical protein
MQGTAVRTVCLPRSRVTVGARGIRSIGVQVCVLPRLEVHSRLAIVASGTTSRPVLHRPGAPGCHYQRPTPLGDRHLRVVEGQTRRVSRCLAASVAANLPESSVSSRHDGLFNPSPTRSRSARRSARSRSRPTIPCRAGSDVVSSGTSESHVTSAVRSGRDRPLRCPSPGEAPWTRWDTAPTSVRVPCSPGDTSNAHAGRAG